MKRIFNQDKITSKRCGSIFVIFVIFSLCVPAFGQDEEKKEDDGGKPARPAFESAQLMDDQSVVVQSPKTLEFNLQHRFGTVNANHIKDLYGIYAPANIRMGFSYTPIKNLAVGFGTSKLKMYVDVNAKYAILKQTKDWRMPVSVTIFTDAAIDTRSKDAFPKPSDASGNKVYRLAFFNELIIARRVSSKLSLQVAPSYSHYNSMDKGYSHNMVAIGFSGRYKISPQSSLMFNYTQPLTSLNSASDFKPKPGLTFGCEIATSAHAFQMFATTFQGILPQQNISFNELDYAKGQFLIGFNITRLWGF